MPTNTIPAANSHLVNLTTAAALTAEFRSGADSILQTQFQSSGILPHSETFNRNDIDLLLAQDGCEAVRIYYGMDTSLNLHAILVAVNEDNEDILMSIQTDALVEDIILEEGQRCPIICPPSSPLNS